MRPVYCIYSVKLKGEIGDDFYAFKEPSLIFGSKEECESFIKNNPDYILCTDSWESGVSISNLSRLKWFTQPCWETLTS